MEEENIVKYKFETYKKINSEALIYGLPFTIFFILLVWIILSGVIISAAPFTIKIIWSIIAVSGVIGIFVIYKKFGLKKTLKYYDLFFKDISVIKFNESFIINRKKILKKDE